MLDSCSPYQLIPVQKSSPGKTNADSFDEAYIYKFFTEGTAKYQRLKYIIRVEKYDNAFALKFYAARDRKNDNKYHRIINAYGYRGLVRLLLTCLQVMPDILNKFPKASFVVNGKVVILSVNYEEGYYCQIETKSRRRLPDCIVNDFEIAEELNDAYNRSDCIWKYDEYLQCLLRFDRVLARLLEIKDSYSE